MLGASFKTNPVPLKNLLTDVHTGTIQLPDFQRGWVWDDNRIRSLLASISVSFPIGAIMTLETGGEANFQARMIEGAPDAEKWPDTLLLDGQQRMTSLYQSLFTRRPVRTQDSRGKVVRRHYYADIGRALSEHAERDDWIVSIPDDRVVRSLHGIELDLSSPEREYQLGLFPLDQVFDPFGWQDRYYRHWEFAPERTRLFNDFHRSIIAQFQSYQLPVIELGKTTSKEAVCLVFEKVNTGGVTLTVFELLTASLAAEGFNLREDWEVRERRLETEHAVLGDLQSDEFLQVVTLLSTMSGSGDASSKSGSSRRVGCRRRDILALTVDDYRTFAPKAEDGFNRAAKFLHGEMIFNSRDVPYRSQIVPLAAILAQLGTTGESAIARDRIRRWYWNGVLGETYGGSTETIFARDVPEVTMWIRGDGPSPSTIRDANFQASRLRTLRTRNSAAYKGIYALSMQEGCIDFLNGEPVSVASYFDDRIDIHHIFPQAWCLKQGNIQRRDFNSIINKTALSARTNRRLGGRAPSIYSRAVRREAQTDSRLREIYQSHRIDTDLLLGDNFWGFYRDRAARFLDLIAQAMGKAATMDDADFAPNAEIEEFDDGPIDYVAEAAS